MFRVAAGLELEDLGDLGYYIRAPYFRKLPYRGLQRTRVGFG